MTKERDAMQRHNTVTDGTSSLFVRTT